MRNFNLIWVSIISCIVFVSPLLAVDYPVYSLGINGGYINSGIADGIEARLFFRYSLEAYIPGFQIDVGYGHGFFQALEDSEIVHTTKDDTTFKTTVSNAYPAISGAFHLRPFGEKFIVYFGGGGQFHFVSAHRKIEERYWDDVAEDYQDREISDTKLLSQVKFGYHLMGGFRFLLGKFGTVDVEVRRNFIDISSDDWEIGFGKVRWGKKNWESLTVSAGLTVFIF